RRDVDRRGAEMVGEAPGADRAAGPPGEEPHHVEAADVGDPTLDHLDAGRSRVVVVTVGVGVLGADRSAHGCPSLDVTSIAAHGPEPAADGPRLAPMTDRRRLAVRITRDAERQIRGGHPW